MNHSSVAQRSLPLTSCPAMSEPKLPWVAHPAVREAFDQADRLQSCLDGFAALMSNDRDAIQGKSREAIESLVIYLNEKHREAVDQAREATWKALDAAAHDQPLNAQDIGNRIHG
jgi:hypothetical protein